MFIIALFIIVKNKKGEKVNEWREKEEKQAK